MSVRRFLNIFILQWLFIRLTKCTDECVERVQIRSVSDIDSKHVSVGYDCNIIRREYHTIQLLVLPLSGYGSKFICLSKKPIHIRVSRIKKSIN